MAQQSSKIIQEIIKTGHRITDEVSLELKEYGITEPQYNVMRILRGAQPEPLAVEEIQHRMIQRSSNVSRIIDKLLEKKFVTRSECKTNRRKMDISITEEGLKNLSIFDEKVHAITDPMIDNLEEKEQVILKILIKKLNGKQND